MASARRNATAVRAGARTVVRRAGSGFVWVDMPSVGRRKAEPYLTISRLAVESGMEETDLVGLLDSGVIEGVNLGDEWLATATAVRAYQSRKGGVRSRRPTKRTH